MLRLLVLLLALANAGYFAWSHGMLAPYGFAPAAQSEPQRLTQQLHPEALRILTPPEARQLESKTGPASESQPVPALAPESVAAPDPTAATTANLVQAAGQQPAAATQCLQAGLFSDEQTATLQARLQNALPAGSWVFESSIEPARWMIYMGKYASADLLAKKRAELRQRNVSFQSLNDPALEPGLSLGNFSDQLDAQAELERIARLGVKTARVIQSQPELRGQKLKLAAATPDLRAQLEALKPQLLGKTLQACR
ncbi:MAG: SPOR domain-containing protein [Polaromonas sp.]|nr:MAG: SPOR domain-containing protein [Polaromonas sp.]